jgi:hypothetical protein
VISGVDADVSSGVDADVSSGGAADMSSGGGADMTNGVYAVVSSGDDADVSSDGDDDVSSGLRPHVGGSACPLMADPCISIGVQISCLMGECDGTTGMSDLSDKGSGCVHHVLVRAASEFVRMNILVRLCQIYQHMNLYLKYKIGLHQGLAGILGMSHVYLPPGSIGHIDDGRSSSRRAPFHLPMAQALSPVHPHKLWHPGRR